MLSRSRWPRSRAKWSSVYVGNDVDPVDHLDVEAHAEPSAGTADPGDVVINPDGTYGGNDLDPSDHLKDE